MASVFLVICLLSVSTPAAPQTIIAVAKDTGLGLAFWYKSSGLEKWIRGQGVGNIKAEKQKDRDAKVRRLQIFPGDVTIDVSDHVRFSAVAYDQTGNTIGGVKVKWNTENPDSKHKVQISQRGEVVAIVPGAFIISAQSGSASAQVTLTVRAGKRKNLNEAPTGSRQISTRDLPPSGTGANRIDFKNSSAPSAGKKSATMPANNKPEVAIAKKAHANRTAPVVNGVTPMFVSNGWDDTNYWSADDPGNSVGNPPGGAMDGGAGSGNFQFAAPILSLPGRGINISLGLAYNSRLWNKAGSQLSYDNDKDWPAPGFNLGFGRMLGIGVYTGAMLVDADGTRHGYTGNITFYNWGTYGVMHTTDGTFIDYSYWTGTNGVMTWGQARLPNGTVVNYGAYSQAGGGLFPTSIEDPNGNFISITYVNNSGPRIQTVTDTLGRTINFYYDYNNLLTAITAPGYDNGSARVAVRLRYHQLSLAQYSNYGFSSSVTASARDSYPWVLDAIYYPGTSTGYWLNDSDSYSSFGMLAKVVEERGMGFSAPSLNDMGSASQGSITRRETYAYPLTPDYSLTDAPTYGSMTESWSRDGTNLDSATTSYSVTEDSSSRSTIVTLPNGTKNKQVTYKAPGQYNDGLVYHDETYVTENTILKSSNTTWEPGNYDSARPTRVEKTDERNQTTASEFSYGSGVYNQVTEARDYDYGGALLRSTRTTFQNSSSYTNNHIFNLPLTTEVFDANNNRISYASKQYDGQTLTDTPYVVMHDDAYNPYAPQYEQCDCYQWDYWWIECVQWNCYWVSAYNSATDARGNITQVTTYADAAGLTGAVTETRRYDIDGNMVTASTSCCDQTTFGYTDDTQYAYQESKTRGSATDPYAQVTTGATYDFNTGLGRSASDANNRVSTTDYDPNTLRPATVSSSTGSHTDHSYDDAGMSVTQTTYLETHPTHTTIADKNVKLMNGRGQIRQEQARAADESGQEKWDFVDTTFDSMGQVIKQTRPYRYGTTPPNPSLISYDALGRTIKVIAPDYTQADGSDGSATQTFYNEASRPSVASSSPGETTRIQDAWGRERWGRTNSSGRLVEVVEPDPNGNGSVASNGMVTTYSYDALGNLTATNAMAGAQAEQTRSFKYDSLGRLIAQKLAEASATLNDSGTYVGSGAWSDVFTYDARSNLTSRTDARGVKTNYDYNSDPLNRLQSISWDTTNDPNHSLQPSDPNYYLRVLDAATVTYSYRTKSSPSDRKDVTQVASVVTSGVSTESFSFDGEGRVNVKMLTLNSRSSSPFATDYEYDALDRVKNITYPAEYLNGNARKVVHHEFDIASRLSGLTYDGQSFASNLVYNSASQTTSLNVGAGTYQISESYSYSAQNGMLDGQTITRGGSTLLNLSYDYVGANGKRTGRLVKISNNQDHNKDRGYEYDAVGRLQRATGGQNVDWVQRYQYDRYGNRNNVFSYTIDAYINNFFQKALGHGPSENDLNTWRTTLRSAYAQGQSQFLSAMQSLGEYIFTLSEYVNHQPAISDHDYVRHLYQTYLMREPDTGGWQFWEQQVPGSGRAAVRAGFAWSYEFWLKVNGTSPYTPPTGVTVSADGLQGISFDSTSNRINVSGFAYDAAGNQTLALIPGSSTSSQRYQYDAANRLAVVRTNSNSVLATYTYGSSNERLVADDGSSRTYYVGQRGTTIAEYTESGGSTTPGWAKSYVYIGARLLSTVTPAGSGAESFQYHHPDRLGTRIVSNPSSGSFFEQQTLPFGTALAESPPTGGTTDATSRRFTSYDRSAATGLDYACNRQYDPQQGRFTQVDPAGMKATNLENPQTLNLYAYCANDPVNNLDPSGLGFFSFLKKVFKVLIKIAIIVAIVVAIMYLAPIMVHQFVLLAHALAKGAIWGILGHLAAGVGLGVGIGFIGGVALGMAYTTLADIFNRCRVPNFDGLSPGRQAELTSRGVTAEQWNNLPNKSRLTYFNVTAAIAGAGLSLEGWLVDWAAGGIAHERVFFTAGPGATNLLGQVRVSSSFGVDINHGGSHGAYDQSYRSSSFHVSLQLSFTPDGTKLDADLDSFNPNRGIGILFHIAEVFGHKLGRLFGGLGTDPVAIGRRVNWECQ